MNRPSFPLKGILPRPLTHGEPGRTDVQGLHIRLVSLEADKLVEIENVLTPEQLAQLRKNRQNAPIELKVSAKPTTPANSR